MKEKIYIQGLDKIMKHQECIIILKLYNKPSKVYFPVFDLSKFSRLILLKLCFFTDIIRRN